MHLVLQNQELLRNICENATSSDLARLSRVQKGIGNLALDVLWEDIETSNLLEIFASGVVTLHKESRRRAFASSPSNADWVRFGWYGTRIRKLQRSLGVVSNIDFENVLYFLKPGGHLLPNLRQLIWTRASFYELPGLSIFFVPSLRTVDLSGARLWGARNPNGLSYEQAAEVTLLELADLDMPLRKFYMPVPGYNEKPIPTLYQARWASLIKNGLVVVDIVPSREVLNALSVVQTLETLTLRFDTWSGTIHELDETPGQFPALKELEIWGAILYDIVSLINAAGCVPNHSIEIHCSKNIPNSGEFSELVDTILRSSRSHSLRKFSLSTYFDNGDSEHPPVTAVTMDNVRSLSPLDLIHFELYIGYPLSMPDDHLKELTSAWPGLHHLNLSPFTTTFVDPPEQTISLRGLRHLMSCAQLRSAFVFLEVKQADVQSLPEVVSICPLTSLYLGDSKIPEGLTTPLSCFLVHLFPKIEEASGGDYGRRWCGRLTEGIRYVQAFRERVCTQIHGDS